MVRLQVNHKDVVLLIMVTFYDLTIKDYLKEHGLYKSMLALEDETQQKLIKYGKEITFLR